MGKRGIALIIAAAALASSAGIAHADEWPPPTPNPTPPPTCGEPTDEYPDLLPCPDPLIIGTTLVPDYQDIAGHWADGAIHYVAYNRDWLRLQGSSFRPNNLLTRQVLAYGLVRAFGRDSFLAPDLVFSDFPDSNGLYRYANVAVSRGWMSAPGGKFNPNGYVTKPDLNAAISRVFDLLPAAIAINAISSSDGYAFKHPSTVGNSTIAHQLHTYYNFPNAAHYEIYPTQRIKRGEFAYALAQLADTGWRTWHLKEQFQSVVLPPSARRDARSSSSLSSTRARRTPTAARPRRPAWTARDSCGGSCAPGWATAPCADIRVGRCPIDPPPGSPQGRRHGSPSRTCARSTS